MKVPIETKLADLIKQRIIYGDDLEKIKNQTPDEHHLSPYCDGDTLGAWRFKYTEPYAGGETLILRILEPRKNLHARIMDIIKEYPEHEEFILGMAKANNIFEH